MSYKTIKQETLDLDNIDLTNNSLKSEIEELAEVCNRIANEDIDSNQFLPPATEELFEEWEKENNIKIPQQYKDFLRVSNGAVIASTTAFLAGVKDLEIKPKYMPEGYVLAGDYGGYGAMICFSEKTGEFIIVDHAEIKEYGEFKNVLRRIIDSVKGQLPSDDSVDIEELSKKWQEYFKALREEKK